MVINMIQVWDWVKVRRHTKDEKADYDSNWKYGSIFWHNHMDEMEGKVYRIAEIIESEYHIVDDLGTWTFAANSLIPVYNQF